MAHQIMQDPMTGVGNRLALVDRLHQSLARLERSPGAVVVVFIDLDNFKPVNDQRGHAAGDHVLVDVAARLMRCTRPGDTVARFGGDEFVVLFEGVQTIEAPSELANRVLRAVRDPFPYGGKELLVTASIGMAVAHDRRGGRRRAVEQGGRCHVQGQTSRRRPDSRIESG